MTARPAHAVMSLFPPAVVAMECRADVDLMDVVLPEERVIVEPAVRKRRAEFSAGRVAARAALRALGFPDAPLLPGPDRAPLWPVGVHGTIAHAGDRAVAAVALAGEVPGLGVDLEPDEAVEEDLWSTILTGRELVGLRDEPAADRGRTVRLVFTAKEALYKCVSSRIRQFLEFGAVEIELDRGARTFAATLRQDPPEGFPALDSLLGRFTFDGGYVISGVWIESDNAEA